MGVWINNGASDDTRSTTMEGRIFNANGTPATGQFTFSGEAVEGTDFFDSDNFVIEELSDGRVVVGFLDSLATDSNNHPSFHIVDPTVIPVGTTGGFGGFGGVPTGFFVTTDTTISSTNRFGGPPVITALGDTGNFVAVWAENVFHPGELYYRIYNSAGQALTQEISLGNSSGDGRLSQIDGFDWDNHDVVYNEANGTIWIGWVGTDGHRTATYTSGPIGTNIGL